MKNTYLRLVLVLSILLLSEFYIEAASPAWKPFDEHTFENAKAQKKLVLLHLRANWCHWCHVMEEKTYMNTQVIDELNKNYITCSEDHDERQDLTSRYADYGWPATIVFDEDGNELYKEAGYIPVEEFLPLLKKLKANPKPLIVEDNKNAIAYSDSSISSALAYLRTQFDETLDRKLGGFNSPQKSIDFETFEYALNHRPKDSSLTYWLTTTMKNALGIYDKVWGGFYQYSTHYDWAHPHYEKLLSVQARYIKMYTWYFKVFGDSSALKKAIGTAKYVNRFLATSKGGYFNAQDADLIKGQKAHEYFKLSNKERLKLGIPAIDSNIYTAENAQLAEAFIYLWSTTGNDLYINKAVQITDYLLAYRKGANGSFMHGADYSATTSLKDNIYMAKTLMMVYRATDQIKYKSEAIALMRFIQTHFYSKQNYYYTYTGKAALTASYNIPENIELMRLFNLFSSITPDTSFYVSATGIMQFLSTKTSEMITEPGILSAAEELSAEPLTGVYLVYKGQAGDNSLLREVTGVPRFYLCNMLITPNAVPESKKQLYESFDKNVLLFCTKNYCSSPIYTVEDLRTLIKKM